MILPLMLGLFGAAVDFARMYNSWINLEAATRDAAEYAATKSTTQADALTQSKRIVCAAFGLAEPTNSAPSNGTTIRIAIKLAMRR